MATKNFFASSTAVQINAFPNKPVRFEDLNFNNLLMAFKTTWVNPETNLNTDVFQVQILEGGGSNVELIGSTYLFPALGATLADFLAILEAQATNSSDYFAIYQDMYAISDGPSYSHSGAAVAGLTETDQTGLQTVENVALRLARAVKHLGGAPSCGKCDAD